MEFLIYVVAGLSPPEPCNPVLPVFEITENLAKKCTVALAGINPAATKLPL
jgi:hypothetical protein